MKRLEVCIELWSEDDTNSYSDLIGYTCCSLTPANALSNTTVASGEASSWVSVWQNAQSPHWLSHTIDRPLRFALSASLFVPTSSGASK